MGVGTPINILEGIERGIDMFDCIMPTRNGRNGQIFTRFGTINMRNKKWENDFSPIDPDAHSAIDTRYSKAYLHHLIKVNEMLGLQLASIHNLAFYLWLVKEAFRLGNRNEGFIALGLRKQLRFLTNLAFFFDSGVRE